MFCYGLTESTVSPVEIEVLETKVLVATDVQETQREMFDGEQVKVYQFTLTEYTKDEYILLQAKKNQELEKQMVQTQLALCDVYELLG